MIIREYKANDKVIVDRLRDRYYTDNEIVDFLDRFHCAFVVETDEHEIITVGGIRPIAEIVARTDKQFSPRIRRAALYHLLEASLFVCGKKDYDQLHCFSQDEQWMRHLKRAGFRLESGQCMILDLK